MLGAHAWYRIAHRHKFDLHARLGQFLGFYQPFWVRDLQGSTGQRGTHAVTDGHILMTHQCASSSDLERRGSAATFIVGEGQTSGVSEDEV
jgi:hypothetical protein